MATPKGHKPGCKCVACSPATRKRGQAKLRKRRAAGEGAAEKPAKKPRKNGGKPGAQRTQRATENTTVVVNMPAQPAAPAKKPRKARRKNPAQPATPAPAEPRARNVGLPSLEAGRFLVIIAREGKGVTTIKGFQTKKAALEHAAGVTGARVRVCEVSHAAG